MRAAPVLRLLAILVLACLSVHAVNNRPVIGILDQPLGDNTGRSYIAASYVKFIEASGARVVPIHYNSSIQHLEYLFSHLNGVLYTGGGVDLVPGTPYYTAGHLFFQRALEANAKGDYFPLWGTCMGFQFLAILAADDTSVLTHGFDSYNIAMPLNFTSLAAGSRMFATAPAQLMKALAVEDITMNNHRWGITPDKFSNNAKLRDFYNVLSLNYDRVGKQFVSTFEAKKAPFYGVQWHPEKANFEWTLQEQLPHSVTAIQASLHTANFFVSEARKSAHAFSEDDLQALLIYNSNPEFTEKHGSTFTQEYIWPATAGQDQALRLRR